MLFSRIVKNTSMLLSGQVFVQFISMILGILVARNLGKPTYGQYSLAFVFMGMFNAFFTFGTDPILVRHIAKFHDQKQEIVNSAFWIRLAGFPITLVMVVIAGYIAGYASDLRLYIFLAALMAGFIAMGDIPRMVFQGLQRMELDALTRVIEKIFALVFVGIGLLITLNLSVVMVALVFSSFLGTLVSWVMLRSQLNQRIDFVFKDILALLQQAAPLTWSMVLVGLYARLPQVILSFYRPVADVGLYSAAYNVVFPVTFLPLAFAGAFLPVLSSMVESSPQSLNKLYESLVTYSLMLGLPLAAGLGLFRREVIGLLFGRSFLPASPALLILSLYVLLYFVEMLQYNVLIAKGQQKKLFIVACASLPSAVLFNLLLVPHLGLVGTAISVVLTEFITLGFMLYFTSHLVQHRLTRKVISSILATGLMVVACLAAGSLSLWLRAPLSVVVYGLGLWATGGVTMDDFRSILTSFMPSSHKSKV